MNDDLSSAGVGPRSHALNQESATLFPGGVSSPVRAFRGVGGEPPVMASAKGAWLTDVDGRCYVDLIGAWGPMILGHRHPEVEAAVIARIQQSVMTGTPSPDETELGRLVVAMLPSVEKVRFVVSGTEACMSALRLARGATGRDKVIKFEGCYHGHADAFLASAGSGALTFGTPDSPGVPKAVVEGTLTVPYNDLEAVAQVLDANRGEVAALFVEPVAGNMGLIRPDPGFLEGLRRLSTEHGVVLVFDEVMTGFRVHPGGAQSLYGVTPDLTCFGKVIGGGLPVGAYGGRADLMNQIAPEGPIYQAGTLAGNPVAMTAGRVTLECLQREGVFERLATRTATLAASLAIEARAAGIAAQGVSVGAMLGLWFADAAPRNLKEAQATHLERFRTYHRRMLQHGVHLPPSPFEAWFLSTAHDDDVIDVILDAHRRSLPGL
jgi:glutamate-1-semialdehyde 2,1-aminomutase